MIYPSVERGYPFVEQAFFERSCLFVERSYLFFEKDCPCVERGCLFVGSYLFVVVSLRCGLGRLQHNSPADVDGR